jgi:hypothetical protein
MTNDDEFDQLRDSIDNTFREFFASLPAERRRKEPPVEPMPKCTECRGTGWAQKEVERGGEKWMQVRMCGCRFPRAN